MWRVEVNIVEIEYYCTTISRCTGVALTNTNKLESYVISWNINNIMDSEDNRVIISMDINYKLLGIELLLLRNELREFIARIWQDYYWL